MRSLSLHGSTPTPLQMVGHTSRFVRITSNHVGHIVLEVHIVTPRHHRAHGTPERPVTAVAEWPENGFVDCFAWAIKRVKQSNVVMVVHVTNSIDKQCDIHAGTTSKVYDVSAGVRSGLKIVGRGGEQMDEVEGEKNEREGKQFVTSMSPPST